MNFDLKFQSTPSTGRATIQQCHGYKNDVISIHALHGEGDKLLALGQVIKYIFQSTPSTGRATTIALLLFS